jgi:hypothetical protein
LRYLIKKLEKQASFLKPKNPADPDEIRLGF